MSKDDVRAYYAAFAEREWQRLTNPDDGAIEYLLTCAMLERHFPRSGRVLDLGGGPGRYTIWLAQRGYRVTLADLSPAVLTIAQTQIADAGVSEQVDAIVEADACDLSVWTDASFDAVVCLGPFYHLPDLHDRERAAGELVRVLRPGGVACIAFIPRYSLLRRTFAIPDERKHLADTAWLARLQEQGIFENSVAGRFTHGYGVQPAEIEPFFRRYGLAQRTLLAAEGITGGLQTAVLEALDSAPTRQSILDILLVTASDPSILGLANHLLFIGERIEQSAAIQ